MVEGESHGLLVRGCLDSVIHTTYDSITMTAAALEQRIEALEREVRLLKAVVKKKSGREGPWWERFGGRFKDDPLFDEMVEAGQRYRRSLRQRSK